MNINDLEELLTVQEETKELRTWEKVADDFFQVYQNEYVVDQMLDNFVVKAQFVLEMTEEQYDKVFTEFVEADIEHRKEEQKIKELKFWKNLSMFEDTRKRR